MNLRESLRLGKIIVKVFLRLLLERFIFRITSINPDYGKDGAVGNRTGIRKSAILKVI